MKIKPINNHVIVEPVKEQSTFQTNQEQFEERGKVIAVDGVLELDLKVGTYVFFDSWCAAKYKDGEGREFWVVPYEKIRAIEVNES